MKKTLADLAVDHDYYCSDCNFYSNDAAQKYATFKDFYEEYHDADIDYNLVFRWDLSLHDDNKTYYLQVFIIGQRKGIFVPCYIKLIEEDDVENLIKFLKPNLEKLKSLWLPLV